MKILIPLPNKDFDLTEVSVPWKLFKDKGYEVIFATENGQKGEVDPKLITGVIFGQLKAKPEAIKFFRKLEKDIAFLNPILYSEIEVSEYNLLHLPGGHAKGMRQYLESTILQQKVLEFYQAKKIIGSICHGCIVMTRTIDPNTKKSIIYNKNITGLIKRLEKLAYYITSWKLGDYYRTYPEYVEDEVSRNLNDKSQFKRGGLNPYKPFVCVDGNIVTARWPEDAYLYGETLIKKLEEPKD
ncbi:MAG: type 1 glutamine amidotransferase domain-containing protein [Flavobacteriaceae bacterium]|nr:type 1 glutamine amidotransferase domain-containing protein [Flavobacteriaceae bacterium]